MEKRTNEVAQALVNCFTSPNETDSNLESANIVDALFYLARSIQGVATEMRFANEKKSLYR